MKKISNFIKSRSDDFFMPLFWAAVMLLVISGTLYAVARPFTVIPVSFFLIDVAVLYAICVKEEDMLKGIDPSMNETLKMRIEAGAGDLPRSVIGELEVAADEYCKAASHRLNALREKNIIVGIVILFSLAIFIAPWEPLWRKVFGINGWTIAAFCVVFVIVTIIVLWGYSSEREYVERRFEKEMSELGYFKYEGYREECAEELLKYLQNKPEPFIGGSTEIIFICAFVLIFKAILSNVAH